MPISKSTTVLTLLASLLVSGVSLAQDATEALESGICPAPISICRDFPFPSLQPFDAPILPCPPGSVCTCVPSCPGCRDCAVQVCVPRGGPECRTACDCEPGLGCFAGRCIPGIAPVFCCDSNVCPIGQICQHRDGQMDRCGGVCFDDVWLCDPTAASTSSRCGDDRVCACTASCPFCLDCGPPVCVPRGAPVPYRCNEKGGCANPGDVCVCASSCPDCKDCPLKVCIPDCDPRCKQRVKQVTHRINRLVRRGSPCQTDRQCVHIDTTTECVGTCGAWVNRRRAPFVEQAIERLDEQICSTYQEDGCPFMTPGCRLERGKCIEGRCAGVPILFEAVPFDEDIE